MRCEYCGKDYPIPQLTFLPAGRVPGLIMERRKAQCRDCMMRRDEPEVAMEVSDGSAPF